MVILAFVSAGAEASTGPPVIDDALAEVVVTGERPGPGLWRVSKGDHDLWILATLSPLPKEMTWRSQAVELRIASSQVVMTSPQFNPDIGIFRGITLLPSLLRARHNPDGKTLEEELPHDLYIRWLALRGLGDIPQEAEIACLAKTMERLETGLPPLVRRANLWAVGDVAGLRAMSLPEDLACQDALLDVPQLKSQFSRIDASLDGAWLAAADDVLSRNGSSFAVLDLAELLAPDGLLSKLRARGYAVNEPQTGRIDKDR